jgi:hypothetical protein
MPFTIDAARAYVTEVHWQFAKTMPQWPHEYTVREWRPDLERKFFAFVDLIRCDGVVKPWPRESPAPRYHLTYLEIDGWEYWSMRASVRDTTVINRAVLTQIKAQTRNARRFATRCPRIANPIARERSSRGPRLDRRATSPARRRAA